VPFASPIWVRLSHAGRPLVGADVAFESDGAALVPADVQSDARGLAVTTLAPREHVVTLRVRARTSAGFGELTTSVPVVPGALLAERRGDRLLVASPIERERAFVTIVSEEGRWFGARVKLLPDGRGARGELPFPALPEARLFAVVESERGFPSGTRVGWPLFEATDEPPLTLDARDALLLDGFAVATKSERERQLGVRRSALGVGLFGALVSIALVLVRVRRDRKRLHTHLAAQVDAETEARLAPATRLRAILAISLIVLGFVVVTVVVAWRLG